MWMPPGTLKSNFKKEFLTPVFISLWMHRHISPVLQLSTLAVLKPPSHATSFPLLASPLGKSTSHPLPVFSHSMSSACFASSKLHNGLVMCKNGHYERQWAESLSLPVWKGMFKSRFPKGKGTGGALSHCSTCTSKSLLDDEGRFCFWGWSNWSCNLSLPTGSWQHYLCSS